jgi:hypothetical protein
MSILEAEKPRVYMLTNMAWGFVVHGAQAKTTDITDFILYLCSLGETSVTNDYINANNLLAFRAGSPIPIEYLPAENSLSSRVRLLILYQGRPTTTIAVGDPLTFRLEAQDGYNYVTDIFATNVIARDPYSGRSVQLIDRYG